MQQHFLPAMAVPLILAGLLSAGEYEQEQDNAVVRVNGSFEDGRVKLRLSDEIVLTVTVEGEFPLQFDRNDTALQQDQLLALRAAGTWLKEDIQTERARIANNRERWRQTIRLDPLKAGEYKLQLIPLTCTEGMPPRPRQIDWQPITVMIETVVRQPSLEELHGITGPEELPPVRSWWLPWLIGLGVLLVGTGLVLGGWELKRRLRAPPPPLTPHEWVLRELQRIEGLNLSASGQAERYHTRISDVLRRYFELRFQLPASQQTTAEFLAQVRSLPELATGQQEQLREFMERCDLAKFAPVQAAPEECQATAALARRLIEQTTPAADPAQRGAGC